MTSVAAIITFLGVLVGLTAGTATADPILDLRCDVSATVHFNPGVNLVPRNFGIVASGIITACVDLTMTNPHVVSGTFTATGTGSASCTLGGSADATATVTWLLSDGTNDTSTLVGHVQATVFPPTILGFGVMTNGRFAGDTVTGTLLTVQANPLDCLTDAGVTQAAGTATAFLSHIP
jgi:hypothetical protein